MPHVPDSVFQRDCVCFGKGSKSEMLLACQAEKQQLANLHVPLQAVLERIGR